MKQINSATHNSTSISSSIWQRINGWKKGFVFTPRDFYDLGSREAIDQTLSRLASDNKIRRIVRGLYYIPASHPHIGELSPTPDSIAQAISRRDSIQVQPTGAYAANSLGLSQQVPAKVVFLTDGNSKSIKVGQTTINFRHATPKNLVGLGTISGTVIQALRYLGKDHIDNETITTIKNLLNDGQKQQLKLEASKSVDWLKPLIEQITE